MSVAKAIADKRDGEAEWARYEEAGRRQELRL
jgi:hypothetical protein